MNKFMLLAVAALFISSNSFAVDFVKLNDAVDKEKAVESVDLVELQSAVKGDEVDYKKAYDAVDKKKASESIDTTKAAQALLAD